MKRMRDLEVVTSEELYSRMETTAGNSCQQGCLPDGLGLWGVSLSWFLEISTLTFDIHTLTATLTSALLGFAFNWT